MSVVGYLIAWTAFGVVAYLLFRLLPITLLASRTFDTDEVVACGIPGYDKPGTELLADTLVVDDDPFAWELSGNCAFTSPFDYSS